ncbi:MAG: carboxypeptidase regulatory-like domain-containing protein [Sulfurovum sp.]|nr:carboxypeptidase regulatory-like domain-containing protein [Sulfurovum sp.]
MKAIYRLLMISLVLFWFMAGCTQQKTPQLSGDQNRYGQDRWGNSSKEDEENIDISDIDQILIESGTAINDETEKVARISFPMDEYSLLEHTGKGTIRGKIYIINGYGKKIYGRTTRLYLNPKTSYSDQWYNESYIDGRKMEKADDRLFNYLRFTSSDINGNFAFYGVPSGSYYLIGIVKCSRECGYKNLKNIRITTEVSVWDEQIVEKDLAGRLFFDN